MFWTLKLNVTIWCQSIVHDSNKITIIHYSNIIWSCWLCTEECLYNTECQLYKKLRSFCLRPRYCRNKDFRVCFVSLFVVAGFSNWQSIIQYTIYKHTTCLSSNIHKHFSVILDILIDVFVFFKLYLQHCVIKFGWFELAPSFLQILNQWHMMLSALRLVYAKVFER